MSDGTQAIPSGRRWTHAPLPRRVLVLAVLIAVIVVTGVFYLASAAKAPVSAPPVKTVAELHEPSAQTAVLAGPPATVAATMAQQLFTSAPVVVLASSSEPAALAAAAQDAEQRSAPLLLTGPAGLPAATQAEISRLRPEAVLAVGVDVQALARHLRGIRVVGVGARLPSTIAPAAVRDVAVLIRMGRQGPAEVAALATAQAAGVPVIHIRGGDPRADPAAITRLTAIRPQRVLALGGGFGSVGTLAARVAVAETGVQLPGGGQILFPGHRLVALYGNPTTPALGALGQQSLTASIARIRAIAARYRALSQVPVVPAFEIIATVAQGSPGPNGLYSSESSVASLRPWVLRAVRAGLYVILDLQPGRANLLAQAKLYRSLLMLPDVGLALDSEWKLQPHELPLRQIGSVSIKEINSVVSWLAALTARYHLPQKLLVLHQFRLSMIDGESQLDTRQSDLAIVIHMDGQGAPRTKEQTWLAVLGAAPRGVFFGWKNFFVKDHPMMSPQATMDRTPQPVMISYQ